MPYIPLDQRKNVGYTPTNPGELNYILTRIVKSYLRNIGECYRTYNDIAGALECCKQELYRRKIAPYEDTKIKKNGDVY